MRLDFAGKEPLLLSFLRNPLFTAIKLHQDGAGSPFHSHTFPADKSGGKEVRYSAPLLMPAHVQGQPDCTAICSALPARTQCGSPYQKLQITTPSALDTNVCSRNSLLSIEDSRNCCCTPNIEEVSDGDM